MTAFLDSVFSSANLSPYGIWLLWRPELLHLNLVSDLVIGLSYYSIAITIAYFILKRPEIAFGRVFCLLAAFILACGTTYLLAIWTLLNPEYGAEGAVKLVTAAISVFTAVLLWPLLPRALALPSPAELAKVNAELTRQIEHHRRALAALRESEQCYHSLYDTLQREVEERRRSQTRLHESIEALSDGLALFDATEGLVLSNSRFREVYGLPEDLAAGGARLEELMRFAVERGVHPDASGDAEFWLAERLNQFRESANPTEQLLADGRWLRVTDSRTPSGGTVSLRADITDLKRTEQHLRDAVSSLPGVFALWDPDDRLRLCNSRFREFRAELGFDEVIGRSFCELTRPMIEKDVIQLADGETAEAWFATRRQHHLAATGEPFTQHFRDGRWLEVRESRTLEGGRVTVIVDITARKETERALEGSEAKFRGFLTASPDAMLVLDDKGTIVLASDRAGALFGYEPAELIGESQEILVPARNAAEHRRHVAGYFYAPRMRQLGSGKELFGRRKDGSEFPVEISLSPHRTAEGLLTLAAIRDLTERRKTEEVLRNLQKMDALGTLAGGIAHDLNNILVPILALSATAAAVLPEDEPVQKYLADVIMSANRAKDLVGQILTFSRTERVDTTELDLAECISGAIRLMRASPSPAIELVSDLPPDPVLVQGNETQLAQVIVNLYTNAAHAIGRQSGKIEISLQVEQVAKAQRHRRLTSGAYAHLRVTDDGCGMDDNTRRRIFEPFFTTKGIGEGTGLGLAVVHGVIASHRGNIDVNSTRGKGTRFDILIPLAESSAEGPSA
jgi:PAS domain S-box-containing protein